MLMKHKAKLSSDLCSIPRALFLCIVYKQGNALTVLMGITLQ